MATITENNKSNSYPSSQNSHFAIEIDLNKAKTESQSERKNARSNQKLYKILTFSSSSADLPFFPVVCSCLSNCFTFLNSSNRAAIIDLRNGRSRIYF